MSLSLRKYIALIQIAVEEKYSKPGIQGLFVLEVVRDDCRRGENGSVGKGGLAWEKQVMVVPLKSGQILENFTGG